MEVSKLVLGIVQTNVYIVINEETKEVVIIDPATESKRLFNAITEEELIPRAVLLTHGHFDHVGGVDKLREVYGIPCYCHKSDFSSAMGNGETFGYGVMKTPPDIAIEAGDELKLAGMTFKVLHTPGHTPGSVCYICDDTALFSGDTLFCSDIGRTDLPGGSRAALKESLAKLAALEDDYILYPGHDRSSSLKYEKSNNPYLNGEYEL